MPFLDDFNPLWLLGLLAVPPLLFLLIMTVVYFVLKLEVTPKLQPLSQEHDHWFAQLKRYFDMVETGLSQEGFHLAGMFAAPTMVSGSKTFLMLMLQPHAKDMALVEATFITQGETERLHACHLELQTEFDDDSSINSTNMEEPYPFKVRAESMVAQLPSIIEPGKLYRLHQYLVKENGTGRRRKWKWTANTMTDLQQDLASSLARLAERGYLHANFAQTHYRLTFKGLLSACTKLIWPFSVLAKSRVKRQERELLQNAHHLAL